ncbi:uncharacterized protein BDR25DRAFT_129618 [Lindgomyces ingoldianus]|uniref:Uncharacterized protein n=1 Tax=Lindgomyces ingoldianus TaxID=673940 RepID=A0ACB6R2C6_9PLEO|nr:uncharacterized protein BDR25DRAFT_129618 [Lindgomyces ingoldianus]KAF2473207.1 hypothetical protein BDR25DRAFT_129618 [Lindgomyces ingoldianus]
MEEELDEAMSHDPSVVYETSSKNINASKNSKHGKEGSMILRLFRGTVKGGVETAIGTDKVTAKVGSDHTKNRLGVVPKLNADLTYAYLIQVSVS